MKKIVLKISVTTAALLAASAGVLSLTNCAGPGYYMQAASGHWSLMRGREPIAEILEDEQTDPSLAEDLALATDIRQFAIDELGLPDSDSYRDFVRTGQDAVVWNVVAAPEFSLDPKQWCFLVSGCVPYRGYFDKNKAEDFAWKMARNSLDVSLSPAIAYSTLGWFSDPLLDTMLQYGDAQLAAYIIHEMAHQMLYVKGDTAFNESYASFVEQIGVRKWLSETRQGDVLAQWLAMEEAARQFNALVQQTREKLRIEYGSTHSPDDMRGNKESILDDMKARYALMVNQDWGGRDYYASWFSSDLNNAQLALINSYQGGECAFAGLYELAGGDITLFHALATEKARGSPADRVAWLEQPCEAIASGDEV
jgi:predicted aminopeptidase